MSYDVYWCNRKEVVDSEDYSNEDNFKSSDLNITFNLCKMFNWAFGVEYWVDEVHGKKGSEIMDPLSNAITKMLRNKKEAEQYNSPNGWGTYPHALEFLQGLLFECQDYPDMYCQILK